MSEKTQIEWCDSSVNPTMGCSGCELWSHEDKPGGGICYAGRMCNVYGGRPGWPQNFAYVETFPGRMAKACAWSDLTDQERNGKPWLDGRPRHIFVGDMGDLFDRDVPFDFLEEEVFTHIINIGHCHFWIFLTKRPGRFVEFDAKMRDFPGWPPPNMIVGVSVTSQQTQWRVAKLLTLPEDIKLFVSFEPLVGPVNIFPMLVRCKREVPLHWLIVGGQSGPGAQPLAPSWVRSVRDLAVDWDIPFFYKQSVDRLSKIVSIPELDGDRWTQMPAMPDMGQGNLL